MADPMALLPLPAVFSQDDLYDPDGFVREAQKVGFESLTARMLEVLHRSGHLRPLVVSVQDEDPAQAVEMNSTTDLRFRRDAAVGRLRDPAAAPGDEFSQRWYSHWQLLELAEMPQLIGRLDATKRRGDKDLGAALPEGLPGGLDDASDQGFAGGMGLWTVDAVPHRGGIGSRCGLRPTSGPPAGH